MMNILHMLHSVNEEKDLRYKLFNKYLIICIIAALFVAVIHVLNNRPPVNILTALIMAAFFGLMLYLSKYKKKI